MDPHRIYKAAGVLESLQAPPTRSGALVHFLLTEDESGLLQSTMFENVFRESGHVLYETGAYLLRGRVEQDVQRGFSFVVERVSDLREALAGRGIRGTAASPTRGATAGSLARARKRGRRAG